jgi:hypothetical protein
MGSLISPVTIGESINIKGDVDLTTEPNKVVKLLKGIKKSVTHRSRPIKDEDKTVVLTVRDHIDLVEQILVVFVGVKFRTIKCSSLSSE